MQAAHRAIAELVPERLEMLLHTAPLDWDARFVEGKTLLGFAVDRFDFDDACLTVLLAHGAQPDRPISRPSRNLYAADPPRPWEVALSKSSSSRFKKLLDAGAKPKLPGYSWHTNPLSKIRQWRDVELLDVALARKWWSSHDNILAEVLKWPEEVRAPRLEALLLQGELPDANSWKEAWWRWAGEGTSQARQWVERFWPQDQQVPPVGWQHLVAFAAAHGDACLTDIRALIEQRIAPENWNQWAPSLTMWRIDSDRPTYSSPWSPRWSRRLALINWALEWGADCNELDKDKVPALLLVLRAAYVSAKSMSSGEDREAVHEEGWRCVEALLLAGASLRRSVPYLRPSGYTSTPDKGERHLSAQAFFNNEVLGGSFAALEKWKPRLEACLDVRRRRNALTRMLGQGAPSMPRAPRAKM